MIETNGYLSGKFKMLSLVFTNRYMSSVVEENICSLKDRVGKQPKFESILIGRRL